MTRKQINAVTKLFATYDFVLVQTDGTIVVYPKNAKNVRDFPLVFGLIVGLINKGLYKAEHTVGGTTGSAINIKPV